MRITLEDMFAMSKIRNCETSFTYIYRHSPGIYFRETSLANISEFTVFCSYLSNPRKEFILEEYQLYTEI